MTIFVLLPEEIVGNTELKNCSAIAAGTKANSSKNIILYEPPRIALEDVAAATILLPFSNSILPLFQFNTPCCKNFGIFS